MKPSILRVLRASAYSVLTILIIIVTVVLVAIGRGYIFDFKTGQIKGGGLVLLDSSPDRAEIYLDNEKLGKATPQRLSLKSGDYNVRLEKANFRPWQKDIPVVSSEVSWAQYPLLVPNDLKTEAITGLSRPLLTSQSPNGKFMAITVASPTPTIQLFELGKHELKSVFSLTPEQTQSGLNIEKISWANDSEHLLVTLGSVGQPVYSVVSVFNSSENIDLTKEFGTAFHNLQFSAQNWRELYWQSPEGLRRLDIGNRTISAVLATGINRFLVSEDAIFLIQQIDSIFNLARLERDNQTRVLASNLAPSDYQLAYSLFEDKSVVALADAKSNQLRLFDAKAENQSIANPIENIPVANLVVSPDKRYLVMYSGGAFATYDFEFKRLYKFSLPTDKFVAPNWLGNYHLLTTIGETAHIFEFDGANLQQLAKNLEGAASFGTRNRDLVYSFNTTASPNSLQLMVSRLKP